MQYLKNSLCDQSIGLPVTFGEADEVVAVAGIGDTGTALGGISVVLSNQ